MTKKETCLKKLNILFFTSVMKQGGTERVILQMCKILKDRVNKIYVCSSGGDSVKQLEQLGIEHITISDIESKSPVKILKNLNSLKKIVKEKQIDIIHSHHRMAAFFVRLSGFAKSKVHFINVHNTFYNKKRLTRYAYKYSRIFAVGEKVKSNLLEYYKLPEKQVYVLRNAVEPFDGNVTPLNNITDFKNRGCKIVCNVGRLTEQKGMEYFIRSLPLVKKEVSDIKYLIAGDGDLREYLSELVKSLDLSEDVIFLGYRTDIRNVMAQSDFVVLSSLWEGLPLTPLEAFSVKKTIVATAVDGTIEVVKDGENGLSVPPENPQAIAEKVIELCQNSELRERLEEKAFETYNTHFSFESYSGRVLDYYNRLINNRLIAEKNK